MACGRPNADDGSAPGICRIRVELWPTRPWASCADHAALASAAASESVACAPAWIGRITNASENHSPGCMEGGNTLHPPPRPSPDTRRPDRPAAFAEAVDRGDRHAELTCGTHGTRHDVGNVVPLEIEKHTNAALRELLDERRTFAVVQHRPDLGPS